MKKNNNVLDEMQEEKLLKIEHNTMLIAQVGLLAAIAVQWVVYGPGTSHVFGECLVLLTMSLYMVFACVKNGIWSRKSQKPSAKTNVTISFAVSLVAALVTAAVSYARYHAWKGAIATFAVIFVAMFALYAVAFAVTSAVYTRRSRQLEQDADREEREE